MTDHGLLSTGKVLLIDLSGCLFLRRVSISFEIHYLIFVLCCWWGSLAIVEEELLVDAHLRLALIFARLETGARSVHVHGWGLGLRTVRRHRSLLLV